MPEGTFPVQRGDTNPYWETGSGIGGLCSDITAMEAHRKIVRGPRGEQDDIEEVLSHDNVA